MKVLQIYLSKLAGLNIEFLDYLCLADNHIGKKQNNYWIINTDITINGYVENQMHQVHGMNQLLQRSAMEGFTSLMIIER